MENNSDPLGEHKEPVPIKKIRVFIVEDIALMIDGLTAMLEKESDIEVVGSVQQPELAESEILRLKPDVVLMDVEFEGTTLDGITAAAKILEKHPIHFLMLTSYDEIALIKSAYRQGIKGYVPKNTSRESLVEGIKKVAQGKPYFDPVLEKIFEEEPVSLDKPRSPKNEQEARYPLSKRELEVAMACSTGLSRKQIADSLFISPNTVDTHFKNMYSKLNIGSNTALFNWMRERELI